MRGWSLVLAVGLFACLAATASEAEQTTDVDFAKIKPIFEQSCYKCHGAEKQRGRLRLDRKAVVFSAEHEEPLIVPGDPEKSLLYQLLTLPSDDRKRMPKKADPLAPEQIALIAEWIKAGATWPDADPNETYAVRAAPKRMKIELAPLTDAQKQSEETALEAVRQRGGLALRVAANTIGLDVNFTLTSDLSDEDLDLLAGCEPTLVWLNLAGASLTDDGLAKLRSFDELRRLHLERTPIGDAGLKHLGRLEKLTYLNLYGTAVTDEGLKPLERLTNLRRLYLWKTQVTDEGVAALQAALPELIIDSGKQRLPLVVVAVADEKKEAKVLPGCCKTAVDAGKTCDHPCCVEAAKADKICPKCSKG